MKSECARRTVFVLEDAVLLCNVRATQLDVLRSESFRSAGASHALLDVVDETLGHEWIFAEVDQVRHLREKS